MGLALIDWIVLSVTVLGIVAYGTWKTKKNKNIEGYLLGGKDSNWATVGLSIMATQASAITFLSTPGKAYESGMEFIQNYLGLPIALVIIAVFFVPIYHRLKVYTAYEYLENRFNLNIRLLGAFLFLIQRGLAAGITIYAPALILTTVLGWDITLTVIFVGVLVIIYTVSGGTKAVSVTHKWQMAVIMLGMVTAFFWIIFSLPEDISIRKAIDIAGTSGRLNPLDIEFNLEKRYTIWSGILGGIFLSLSYFGTDQSQVQRYLSAKSISESRLGLMFNAILKIPMQLFILFIGIMVFVFFQFEKPPIWFNQAEIEKLKTTKYATEYEKIDQQHTAVYEEKLQVINKLSNNNNSENRKKYTSSLHQIDTLREKVKTLISKSGGAKNPKDYDYVFISYVLNYLPKGLIGLLLAVILSAALSSTAGEVNALASTTTVDFYKRVIRKTGSEKHYLKMSKLITLSWGLLAIVFALFATKSENLIELVNILGSIFYGPILGIFLVAFLVKFVQAKAVFFGAIISQVIVIYLHFFEEIGFLWYNAIGAILVTILSIIIQLIHGKTILDK